jgi:hypothetical protein
VRLGGNWGLEALLAACGRLRLRLFIVGVGVAGHDDNPTATPLDIPRATITGPCRLLEDIGVRTR